MGELDALALLRTDTVAVWDVDCAGRHRNESDEECSTATHLVFPHRGVYVHRVGGNRHVGEANQVVFINEDEPYTVSHPVPGGDASISIGVEAPILAEMIPGELRHPKGIASFNRPGLRVDAYAQSLAAQLRQRLQRATIDDLEAESLTLDLVGHTLGHNLFRTLNGPGRRVRILADDVKLLLSSDPARRWTLQQIATEVSVSPVYLTDVFRRVEGIPVYRYQLQLRLARALSLLADSDDLTSLALELGFASHSHFTAAFKQNFHQTPSAFQRTIRRA
jgi:AraC family transcriptional regulator